MARESAQLGDSVLEKNPFAPCVPLGNTASAAPPPQHVPGPARRVGMGAKVPRLAHALAPVR